MMQRTPVPQTGPRHRISADDLSTARGVLDAAFLCIEPDDQKQRKAFEQLMPQLYVLRNKGCSFEQLTKLLSKSGFKLQPSTVKTYYSEMLATRLDLCQARMTEQLAVMAALRKKTAGAEMPAISSRVEAVLAAHRSNASGRIDSVLTGIVGEPAPALAAPAAGRVPAGELQAQAPAEPSSSAGAPTDESTVSLPTDSEKPAAKPVSKPQRATAPRPKPAQAVEAPEPPIVAPAVAATQAGDVTKTLRPLQPGVPPLKPRPADTVPPEVYEDGVMEHPAIPGLMLTLLARLYGAALEYIDVEGGGEILTETPDEKRKRVTWKKPVPVTNTRTGESFTQMDTGLFKR